MLKNRDITFQTFLDALMHQWKRIFCITLVFAILGAGAGAFYAGKLSSSAAGSAVLPKQFLFDFVEARNESDYIEKSVTELNTRYQDAVTYLETLQQEKTLTVEQKKRCLNHREQLKKFEVESLVPIGFERSMAETPFFPEEVILRETRKAEHRAKELREALVRAEEATKLIGSMQLSDLNNEQTIATYNTILSRAENYGNLKVEIEKNQQLVQLLKDNPDEITAKTAEMERSVKEAGSSLNLILTDMENTVGKIAKENYLVIDASYVENTLKATISHTYNETPPRDIFIILTLFCTLLGCGFGLYWSVYKECCNQE